MKALIFSDTHGRINKAVEIIKSHKNVDLIIHLGDLVKDAQDMQIIFDKIHVEYVTGNNDFASRAPYAKTIEFGDKRFLLTHGHKYGVKNGFDILIKEGKEMNVDAVLFGHTHQSYEKIEEGILYFNPGSLILPVNGMSYGLLEVQNGKLYSMICNL